jgi:drug/metabolite transporter (DMT)-like permease
VTATPIERPVAQSPALGILLRVLAMALMAVLAAIVKACAERGVPVLEIIFFRNAFAFIPVMLYIWRTSGFGVLRTRRPGAHLTRSAVGLTGMICGFTAVSLLPLTQSTAISFSAPLFMVALSALILKEPVSLHRWLAVAVGFVGVLIMVHPDPRQFVGVGVLFAIAAAIGAAGANIAIREISRTEPGPTIVFYFTLAGAAVGLASLPFGWVMPSPGVLGLLVAAGLIGGTGQLLLTEAIRRAPVAVVAPFDYTQLVWAGLIGFLVWGETPAMLTLIGAMVVAASSTYILWREIGRSRT